MFCGRTHAALLAFQDAYGLRADGECDEVTWSMLVEASWSLGDRLLYLRSPNIRGDDVAELQSHLSRLGFDCGRVDGIYGPLTVRAVTEFQQNCGLAGDGICGPTVVDTLGRIGGQSGTGPGIAAVRETESLGPDSNLHRIAVGQYGTMSNIAHAVSRRLKTAFPQTIAVEGDPVDQALTANRFGADVYVALEPSPDAGCTFCYYEVPTFFSVGGKSLALRLSDTLSKKMPDMPCRIQGLRMPVLRETKMPAVVCAVGPVDVVLQRAAKVVDVVVLAVSEWLAEPLG